MFPPGWHWILWMDLHQQIWAFMVLSRYKSNTYSSACHWKGNKKRWNYDTQSSLVDIKTDDLEQRCNQFVGFVTSHRKGNVLVSFHIHSFAVFYTEEGPATIVTCLLTARNHILSNMQDQILQIVQLIQYRTSHLFSMTIMNDFIGRRSYLRWKLCLWLQDDGI